MATINADRGNLVNELHPFSPPRRIFDLTGTPRVKYRRTTFGGPHPMTGDHYDVSRISLRSHSHVVSVRGLLLRSASRDIS